MIAVKNFVLLTF